MTKIIKKSGRPRVHVYPIVNLPPYFKGVLFSHLKTAGKVEVRGLGIFTVVEVKGRTMYHNFSEKKRYFLPYKKLKFIQSQKLKKELHD